MSNFDQAVQISSETCKTIIYWAIGCGGWVGVGMIPIIWKRNDMSIARFFLAFATIPVCASLSAFLFGSLYIMAGMATIVGRIMLNPAFMIPSISVVSMAILTFLIGTANHLIGTFVEFEEYKKAIHKNCESDEESDESEENEETDESAEESEANTDELNESGVSDVSDETEESEKNSQIQEETTPAEPDSDGSVKSEPHDGYVVSDSEIPKEADVSNE